MELPPYRLVQPWDYSEHSSKHQKKDGPHIGARPLLCLPVSLCEAEVRKQLDVELDSLFNFGDFDVFVGCVAATALPGAHLEAGAGEKRLVAQGGAAVGCAAQFDGAAHELIQMPGAGA